MVAVLGSWSATGNVLVPSPRRTPIQLVELELGEEDVVGDVAGPAQSAAVLVVGEHGLEARTVAVEEQLVASTVVVAASARSIAEQRRRVPAATPCAREGNRGSVRYVDGCRLSRPARISKRCPLTLMRTRRLQRSHVLAPASSGS